MSQPNLWLIKEGFGSTGQPVNTSGGDQLKTNPYLIALLWTDSVDLFLFDLPLPPKSLVSSPLTRPHPQILQTCQGPYNCGVDTLLNWFEEVVVGLIWQSCGSCSCGCSSSSKSWFDKRRFRIISQPNLWLIKEVFGRASQPVNMSGGRQLKMNIESIALLWTDSIAPLPLWPIPTSQIFGLFSSDPPKSWLDQFVQVVVLAVVVIVHPPNLDLIKEGFGIMSQPNLWLTKEAFGRGASQSTPQEVTS